MHPKRESKAAIVMEAQQTIMQALMEDTAAEWLQLDLTMGQVKTLFVLQCSGAMSVGGLAERLKIGLPAASIAVDKLVQLALVARRDDPSDRRRTLVELTPQGEQVVSRLHQGRHQRLRTWLGQLREADVAALVQGLQALAAVAGTGRVEPERQPGHRY